MLTAGSEDGDRVRSGYPPPPVLLQGPAVPVCVRGVGGGRGRGNWIRVSLLTWPQLLFFVSWLLLLQLTVATDTLSVAGDQMVLSPLEDLSPAPFLSVHFAPPQILPSCQTAGVQAAPLLPLPPAGNYARLPTFLTEV